MSASAVFRARRRNIFRRLLPLPHTRDMLRQSAKGFKWNLPVSAGYDRECRSAFTRPTSGDAMSSLKDMYRTVLKDTFPDTMTITLGDAVLTYKKRT